MARRVVCSRINYYDSMFELKHVILLFNAKNETRKYKLLSIPGEPEKSSHF